MPMSSLCMLGELVGTWRRVVGTIDTSSCNVCGVGGCKVTVGGGGGGGGGGGAMSESNTGSVSCSSGLLTGTSASSTTGHATTGEKYALFER